MRYIVYFLIASIFFIPNSVLANIIEPKWTTYKAVANRSSIGIGKTLADIDNHLDYSRAPGTSYRNSVKFTWAHETTHGINGILRNIWGYKLKSNCFYCLNDRVAIIKEPNITLNIAKNYVPKILRDDVFSTMQRHNIWPNNPLYVCDEWIAYTNGTEVMMELDRKKLPRKKEWGGTVNNMMEHMIYTFATLQAIKERDPKYDDRQLKAFVMWNASRNMRLYKESKSYEMMGTDDKLVDEYLKKFRTHKDAKKLRDFIIDYFGEHWVENILSLPGPKPPK